MKKTKHKFNINGVIPDFPPNKIKELREDKLKVSQSLFAELLGVSKQTINSWECGWRKPSPLAQKILNIFYHNPTIVQNQVMENTENEFCGR